MAKCIHPQVCGMDGAWSVMAIRSRPFAAAERAISPTVE